MAFNGEEWRSSYYVEEMSKHYRQWYVQGQADYRAGNPPPEEIQGLEMAEEAWNMGWQSDAFADEKGLLRSWLGTHNVSPTSLDDFKGYTDNNNRDEY